MESFQTNIKKVLKSNLLWPLVGFALIMAFNFFFTPGFFKVEMKEGHLYGRFIDIINRAAPLMMLAIGMTLVIATKGIDISVGSVCAISGAITAFLMGGNVDGSLEHNMVIVVIAALTTAVVLEMWNGFLVSKLKIQPVVATLILMVAGRGIAQLISWGQILTIYYKPFSYVGSFVPGIIFPTSIFLVLILVVIAYLAVKKTALGLFIQSVGINDLASKFSGIKVNRIIFMVYAFCGLCAGVAGLILCSMIKAADSNNAGLFIEMDAILAVALGGNSLNGGKFSIAGSLIGALIIQSLTTTMYAVGVSPQVLPVVKLTVGMNNPQF